MRSIEEEEVDRTKNAAAEREVIGSVIKTFAYADEAMKLKAEDFTNPSHQIVWRAIAHILDKGDPIKLQNVLATCGNALDSRTRQDLEEMVLNAGGTQGMLQEAISAVLDAAKRRRAAYAYAQARRRAIYAEDPIESTVVRAAMEVDQAVTGNEDIFLDGYDVSNKLRKKLENPPRPIPTGIRKFDNVLEGGLMSTRMIGIGAQTKVGKTTLAGTISYNVLQIEEPHLVISLERHETDIEQNCAARALGTKSIELERDYPKYRNAYLAYQNDPLHRKRFYAHRPGATIEEIQSHILRAHRAGAKGFILDYYQLIQKPPRESVTDHLSRCAQTLARLTDRLGMWSIINAQTTPEGIPRECQALYLAAAAFFVIRRDSMDQPGTWLQCMGSTYTKEMDAGGPGNPCMMLDTEVGPHFRDY
jgi:replicative DNA helicase